MSELKYGLKADIITKIQTALAQFNDIQSVVLYGSRAKGNYKNGSDIDLSIKTKKSVDTQLLFDVIGAIDELDLIYYFDISLFCQIDNPDLIEHINRVGVEFYNAKTFANE